MAICCGGHAVRENNQLPNGNSNYASHQASHQLITDYFPLTAQPMFYSLHKQLRFKDKAGIAIHSFLGLNESLNAHYAWSVSFFVQPFSFFSTPFILLLII